MIHDPGGWVYRVCSGGAGVLHFRPCANGRGFPPRGCVVGTRSRCAAVVRPPIAFAVIISASSVISVATPVAYDSAPQSVNFFANYEEFRTRHTAPLADVYRRQTRRLCEVWLRLCRAGDNFVPCIPLNDAFAVIISVYSVISVATPVVYNSA